MRFMLRGLLICFIYLIFAAQAGAVTVCRLPGLAGHEQSAERAKAVLPPDTRNISQLAVYIERDSSGELYYHSNFISEGAEHATKIGGPSTPNDLLEILNNIVWTGFLDGRRRDIVRRAYESEQIQIFVDRSVFQPDGTTTLQFGRRNNFTIVTSTIDRPPVPGSVEDILGIPRAGRSTSGSSTRGIVLRTDTPPPVIAQLLSGCCLFGRPVGIPTALVRRTLQQVQIRVAEVQLVSLVRDSATANAIASSRLNASRTAPEEMPRSAADLRPIFEANRGKQVMILGHVEEQFFVTRDSRNRMVSKFPLSELRSMAVQNDVLLIEVGCNTATAQPQGPMPGVSTASRLNTVDAVNRISEALSDPSISFEDFLQRISYEDLHIVVDSTSVDRYATIQARYFLSRQASDPLSTIRVTTSRPSLIQRIRQAFAAPSR